MPKNYIILLFIFTLAACDHHVTKQAEPVKKSDSTVNAKSVSSLTLIVPGKSVGQLRINQNADSVFKLLGKPDSGDAAMGKSLSTWFNNHDTSSYQTQIFFSRQMGTNNDVSRVKQIRITSPLFQTSDNIGTGISLQVINSTGAYHLQKIAGFTNKSKPYIIYDDLKTGIAFETDDQQKCTGIIIHEAGKNINSYMPFHDNTRVLSK